MTVSHVIVQTGHQLEVPEQYQDADRTRLQSQDMNPIENLWRKVTLEIVKRHPTIKRIRCFSRSRPPGTGKSPTTTWSSCPLYLNSDTMLKSDYEQRLDQLTYMYTNWSSTRKSGPLKATT